VRTEPLVPVSEPEAESLIPAPREPVTYVTEISVPDPGDGGVQHLRSHFLQPEGEPEPEA
jgi:hypothetical protein